MSLFDIGSASGLQNSAVTVASSLAPKKSTAVAADLKSLGAGTLTAKAATSTTTSSTATGGNITANDFLTLLVTELKHQDPTQPTDPNAYISQLVSVNSLQQLIAINKGITSIGNGGSGTTTPTAPVTKG